MNICFIVNKNLDPNSLSFIYPILLNKKFLDFNIEIENKIPSKNYDIIIIEHPSTTLIEALSFHKEADEAIEKFTETLEKLENEEWKFGN